MLFVMARWERLLLEADGNPNPCRGGWTPDRDGTPFLSVAVASRRHVSWRAQVHEGWKSGSPHYI